MRPAVWILMLCGALSLSFVSAPAIAQTPSVSDLKKEAELQKKAAKAKDEWAKAEEKLKKLEKELRDAQEERCQADCDRQFPLQSLGADP